MRSRWDMLEHAPDILITNFSMLNVMLMREREDTLFTSTRDWLERDSKNRFSLVVDELHSYRGTQGTEVALVVRNLLDRPRVPLDAIGPAHDEVESDLESGELPAVDDQLVSFRVEQIRGGAARPDGPE